MKLRRGKGKKRKGAAQLRTRSAGNLGAGRPRQAGERYPSGKLKPPPETPRQAPLYITVDEVAAYAELHRRAGIALPTVQVADLTRVRGSDNSLGCPKATATLRRIWARLERDPLALIALTSVCLLDEVTGDRRRGEALARGLTVVAAETEVQKPPARARPFRELAANDDPSRSRVAAYSDCWPARSDVTILPLFAPGPTIEDVTVYVDVEGATLFEAVRRRRRRA